MAPLKCASCNKFASIDEYSDGSRISQWGGVVISNVWRSRGGGIRGVESATRGSGERCELPQMQTHFRALEHASQQFHVVTSW
jgi:hypothetical protein